MASIKINSSLNFDYGLSAPPEEAGHPQIQFTPKGSRISPSAHAVASATTSLWKSSLRSTHDAITERLQHSIDDMNDMHPDTINQHLGELENMIDQLTKCAIHPDGIQLCRKVKSLLKEEKSLRELLLESRSALVRI